MWHASTKLASVSRSTHSRSLGANKKKAHTPCRPGNKCAAMVLLRPTTFLVVLAALPTLVPAAPKYFGWYGDVTPTLSVTGATSNLVQANSVASAIIAKAAGQDVLLLTEAYFPGLRAAKPDFKTVWEAALPELKSLITNKTIFGFALGDELVWGSVTPANLVEYANTVRASFPRGEAVIWYNEACFFSGPRSGWHNGAHKPVPDYTIPEAIDWFSIDQYHMDGPVPGWVQAHVEPWYQRNIYPNLTKYQSVMVVPGAFGSNVNHYPNGTFICDNACYDKMCAQDAGDFYEWARRDPRVVAISPWNWMGCAGCNGSRWTPPKTCCMDEIGARDQPLTRAAWFKIGAEIKENSQVAISRPQD